MRKSFSENGFSFDSTVENSSKESFTLPPCQMMGRNSYDDNEDDDWDDEDDDDWDDEFDEDDEDLEDYDSDDTYYEVECPSCGETICFDGSIDPEELMCPACGEKFECLLSEEDLKELDAE